MLPPAILVRYKRALLVLSSHIGSLAIGALPSSFQQAQHRVGSRCCNLHSNNRARVQVTPAPCLAALVGDSDRFFEERYSRLLIGDMQRHNYRTAYMSPCLWHLNSQSHHKDLGWYCYSSKHSPFCISRWVNCRKWPFETISTAFQTHKFRNLIMCIW